MLFLVDKPMAEIAFRTANTEPEAEIVLIQDGVLLDPAAHLDADGEVPVYAVERDLSARGVSPSAEVEPIRYDALVEKIVDQEVKSFV